MNKKENKDVDAVMITMANYVRPLPVENKGKDWVFNGKNNSFYQTIIDMANNSPTNSSIIKSYTDLIYGKGITASNASVNANDWARFVQLLSKKDLKRIIADFQLFGEASMQVIRTRDKKSISSIKHVAKNKVVPSIANLEGEIEGYWFSQDFTETYKSENTPVFYPAFGTSNEGSEIYVISPYQAGQEYFSSPDYISALPYAEMESEIANLNLNSIRSGLSYGYIINVPNGINWSSEQKVKFKKQVEDKLTGSSNASNFIISFNGLDVEVTVTPMPTNENIHKQWEVLNDTAAQKILTSHRAISPSIVGIVSSSGFSNTADEMAEGEAQVVKRVIEPKQSYIIDALEEILASVGINLDLYFRPFTDAPVAVEMKAQKSHVCLSDVEMNAVLEKYAQDAPDGYEMTDGSEFDLQLSANQTSEQDSKLWKIRYEYTKGTSKSPKSGSRLFCNKMLLLAANGKVYRKEDIELMSSQGVNGSFAHSGGKYDIFLFGGGVNCYHRWERRIFKKKLDADGNPKKGGAMASTTQVNVNEAKRQGAKLPKNSPDVAKAEIDKPNKGAY
jgi:hypothetical protein